MRFKPLQKEGGTSIMLLTTLIVCLTSTLVLASPILQKPELGSQDPQSDVESTFYIISGAAAGVDEIQWLVVPADSGFDADVDVGVETDLADLNINIDIGSLFERRDLADEEIGLTPSPTGVAESNESLVSNLANNQVPPIVKRTEEKRPAPLSTTSADDGKESLMAGTMGNPAPPRASHVDNHPTSTSSAPDDSNESLVASIVDNETPPQAKRASIPVDSSTATRLGDNNESFIADILDNETPPEVKRNEGNRSASASTTADGANESLMADIVDNQTPPKTLKRDSGRDPELSEGTKAKLTHDIFDTNVGPKQEENYYWAMICNNMNPDNGSRGGSATKSLPDRCRIEKGYMCTSIGTFNKKMKADDCDLYCRCKNLCPAGACIQLALKPAIGCVRVRIAEVHSGAKSYLEVRSVQDASATSSSTEDSEIFPKILLGKRFTLVSIDNVIVSKEALEKRHNWALVCYDTTSQGSSLDKAFTDHCIQKYSYTCLGDGKKSAKTVESHCESECNCVDLYPKNKALDGILLSIKGQNKFVSKARRFHSAEDVDVADQFEKRHNWALVCMKEEPLIDPALRVPNRQRTKDCANKYGYTCTCDGKIDVKKEKEMFCDAHFSCIDLYPKSRPIGSIVFEVLGRVRHVSRHLEEVPKSHEPAELEKRHSWALVCSSPSRWPDSSPDKGFTRTCTDSYGYTCLSTGKLSWINNQVYCDTDCKCVNLYPKNDLRGIVLKILGNVRKVSRDLGHDPSSSVTSQPHDKRHNFALVCYSWINLPDRTFTKACADRFGYTCLSDGRKSYKTLEATCRDECKCVDLYPKSNFGISLNILGTSRYVSRDVETSESSASSTDTDQADGINKLDRRHNWAIVCYDDNIRKNPDALISKKITNKCIASFGYTCLEDGTKAALSNNKICDQQCGCRNLYPQSQFRISLNIGSINRIVSRDVDSASTISEVATDEADNVHELGKRHNFAIVCYESDPSKNPNVLISKRITDNCVLSFSYTCLGDGTKVALKSHKSCDENCRCVNLYPKGNLLSLNIGTINRIVSRGIDLDSAHADSEINDAEPTRGTLIEDVGEFVAFRSLSRRHNNAMVCYDQDPFFNEKTAQIDTKKGRECLAKGFTCASGDDGGEMLRTKDGDAGDCYNVCRCQNLYPHSKLIASCAIALAIMGNSRCITRRDIQQVPGIDVPTIVLTDQEVDSLTTRHNFALACYDRYPLDSIVTPNIDTEKGRKCREMGFNCNLDGTMSDKAGSGLDCYDVCRCENIDPKSKFLETCMIALTVHGSKKCITRRDFDLALGVPKLNNSGVSAQTSRPLEARHTYALTCYNENPWYNPFMAVIDTTKSRECLREGFNCEADGSLKENLYTHLNCFEVCRCENMYPKSNFLEACALALTVYGMQRCVSRRNLDLVQDVPTPDNVPGIVPRSLEPRHNWAVVCYDRDPHLFPATANINTRIGKSCLDQGYNCDSEGIIDSPKLTRQCDDNCKCENLYPKSAFLKACALALTVQGVKKCVSRRYERLTDAEFDIPSAIDHSIWPSEENDAAEIEFVTVPDFAAEHINPGATQGPEASFHNRKDFAASNMTNEDRDRSLNSSKLQLRDEAAQQNTTISQDTTVSQDTSDIQLVLNCQDPLMTLRCLFEVGGYYCHSDKSLWSIWNEQAPLVTMRTTWIQPDWRTCNCVCQCIAAPSSKRAIIELPTPEEVRERILAYDMTCADSDSTKTCADQKYFCDHQGGLRQHYSGSPNAACQDSCLCLDPNAASTPGEVKAKDPKLGLARRKRVTPMPNTKREETGRELTAESASSLEIVPNPERPGKYLMKCNAGLTEECKLTDRVRCSVMGILHTEDNSPVDEFCAIHCKCVWETPEGEASDIEPLPALFHHDATFRPTRHGDAVRRMTRRQDAYNIDDKTHQCDALLHGIKVWTLLCQRSPADDHFLFTLQCAEDANFWCGYGRSDPSFPRQGNRGPIGVCEPNCFCYQRYDPYWNGQKRDLPSLSDTSDVPLRPSALWTGERDGPTTMATVTRRAK